MTWKNEEISTYRWNKEEWNKVKKHLGHMGPIAWKTWSVIICDLILGAGAISLHTLSSDYFLAWPASIVMMLIVFIHFYLLVHEATHSALFKNPMLNDFVAHVVAWTIALPYLPRKRSHMLHHLHTGHPVNDPANRRLIARFAVFTESEKNKLEFFWRNWLPVLVINDRIGIALSPFIEKGRKDIKVIKKERLWSFIYLSAYALTAAGMVYSGYGLMILSLYFPTLFVSCIIEEMINLPHHVESHLLDENDESLHFCNQHTVTHSCSHVPIWSRWILLNFNLHTAHHFYPWAPWHSLEKINDIILKYPELTGEDNIGPTEMHWSLTRRRQPLLGMMGKYFDRIPRDENSVAIPKEKGL